jgi:uncharacterized membrane protein YkoI
MNRSKQARICAAIIAVSSAAALAGEEHKIAITDAPAAVQAAAKQAAGDATITEMSKEVEHGKTVFEAEFTMNGAEHAASFDESGKLIEDEVEIALSDLPKPVSEAVAKELPSGKPSEASKITADGKTFYDVDVTVGSDEHELRVTTDGKLVSNKVEKKDEDDEKHEKSADHK